MKRVRRYMALARRRRESGRTSQTVAIALAGFVAILCAQLAVLSTTTEITLASASPLVWQTLAFTGLLAVFMNLSQR